MFSSIEAFFYPLNLLLLKDIHMRPSRWQLKQIITQGSSNILTKAYIMYTWSDNTDYVSNKLVWIVYEEKQERSHREVGKRVRVRAYKPK